MNIEDTSRQCPSGTAPYIIKKGDTLARIALSHGTTVPAILAANPGIIPEKLNIGQSVCVPQRQPQPPQHPPAQGPTCPIGSSPYEIKSGDTLAGIAMRYSTAVEAILQTNPDIVPDKLYIGQVICIAQEKTEQLICPNQNAYVIRKGDTLSEIAKAFGITLQALMNANPGITPQALYVDQVICIPIAPIPLSITVSIKAKTLTLYKDGRMLKAYPVATGKLKTPSPIGTFSIKNKQVNPGGPYGTRWLGLTTPHYGIHGTNVPTSIGNAASNGCIRMHNKDVEDLFSHVGVGVVVRIF